MILIFSSDSDYSTTKVIEWLRFYKTEFIRINAEDLLRNEIRVIIENNIFHVKLSYNDQEIDLERVKKIWYRGGNLIRNIPNTLLNLEDTELKNVLIKNLSSENDSLIEFFYDYTTKTGNIGSYSTYQLNKLHCLKVASLNGLNVPNTIVTTTKKEVMEFKKKNRHIITKGIQEVFEGYYQSYGYYNATEAITDNCIDEMPDVFFSSLFQEQLFKRVELRIFYFFNECYTSAIFSQLDEKTQIDFRNYNFYKPNRMVRFELPRDIKEKVHQVMNELKMNTGSIDMIYTNDKKYYFLEINPIGQYDFVSKSTNYQLDQLIAKKLMA